jgi:hypothetical protein
MAKSGWVVTMGLAFFGVVGCASTPLPYTEVSHFEVSMDTAKKSGAFQLEADKDHRGALGMSQAKEHLVLAGDQFEVAKTMAAGGDPQSVLLLERAQSDVDLALGLAREAAIRSRATAFGAAPSIGQR